MVSIILFSLLKNSIGKDTIIWVLEDTNVKLRANCCLYMLFYYSADGMRGRVHLMEPNSQFRINASLLSVPCGYQSRSLYSLVYQVLCLLSFYNLIIDVSIFACNSHIIDYILLLDIISLDQLMKKLLHMMEDGNRIINSSSKETSREIFLNRRCVHLWLCFPLDWYICNFFYPILKFICVESYDLYSFNTVLLSSMFRCQK